MEKVAGSVVLEYLAQLFLQLPFGKHILDPAPCRFAPFAHGGGFRATLGAFDQRIKIVRFLSLAEKLIVDIKMFVVAFAHYF